jgi:peptide/nickel transport system permease protein
MGLIRRPAAAISILWIGLVTLAAIWPSLLTNADPNNQDLANILQGPSWSHVLGTTTLGEDVYARIVYGARPMAVAIVFALSIALVLGTIGGVVAGYLGGAVDGFLIRAADVLFAIPGLLILLVVYSVFPYNIPAGMATFGVILSAGLLRIVRSVTLGVREEPYVDAAVVSGLSRSQIMTRHVFPRIRPVLFVQAALIAAIVIVVDSGLAFLGFGPRPPQPSWGGLVAEARGAIFRQSWLLIPSGAAIALTVLALSLIGDALRDQNTAAWAPSKLTRQRQKPTTHVPALRPEAIDAVRDDDASALLSVTNLAIAFGDAADQLEVVSDVTFSVRPGEVVGLVGESGCGKSVTAASVLGMTPGTGRVVRGSCVFEGREMLTATAGDWAAIRGRRIGFVSQEPMVSLDPTYRVGHQLREAVRRHQKCSRRAASDRVIELLESVQLPDPVAVAKRYPHQLSGGMAQRVAIALALAGDPILLIADEPTTALDVTVQAEILDLLRRLRAERQMAVLIITHDWGVAADLCDRVVVMYAGEVVEAADIHALIAQPLHPYSVGLLDSHPERSPADERLVAIPGNVPHPAHWPTGCRFEPRCPRSIERCSLNPVAEVHIGPDRRVRCIRACDGGAPR